MKFFEADARRGGGSGVTGRVSAGASTHGFAIVWFAAIAVGLTAGLWIAPASTLFGSGLGDNVTVVWNFWWADLARTHPDRSLLATDALFAPLGTSLVLHTGTPLLTSLSAIAFPSIGPVAAYNIWIVLALFLNGLCAYAAASHYTGRRDAALLGGTIFAAAPFLVVRVLGHLNVLCAWTLPLLVLAVERLHARPTIARALTTGVTLAAIAFIDYYYFIYGWLLFALLAASARLRIRARRTPITPARRRIALACVSLAAVAVVIAIAAWLTGGRELTIAGQAISVRGTFNLRGAAWLLSIVALLVWYEPRFRLERVSTAGAVHAGSDAALARALAIASITALLLVLPLALEAWRLWTSGDYVAMQYRWRSAPSGIDVASLVLGNPTSYLFGAVPRTAYDMWTGLDVESVAWLGIVPSALLVLAIWRLRDVALVSRWLLVLIVFGVWSLGPYLTLLGANTGFMLPQTLVRFIPLVNNARMPGRAFTLVVLAVAMIAAMTVAARPIVVARRRVSVYVLAALTLLDFWPAPYPTTTLTASAMDVTLRSLPDGAVLELPLGIRDGFGERGRLAHASLYHQTVHEHPLVGGFVARLSDRVRRQHENDAVLAPLMALSAGEPPPAPDALRSPDDSLACAVRYVVVPAPTAATRAAEAFARSVFTLEPVVQAADRSLYTVTGFHAPYCGRTPSGPHHTSP